MPEEEEKKTGETSQKASKPSGLVHHVGVPPSRLYAAMASPPLLEPEPYARAQLQVVRRKLVIDDRIAGVEPHGYSL